MKHWIFILGIFTLAMASPKDKLAWCSAQKQCLGQAPSPVCDDPKLHSDPEVSYSIDFCDDIVQVNEWGVDPMVSKNHELWELLGKKYRMEYPLSGMLPINMEMMQFLLDELPWTAQLINAYQNTGYSASFTNRKKTKFKGANGGSLRGKFQYLAADTTENRYVIQGMGYAKVLKWRLKGDAVLTMDFDPINERQLAYDIKCMAFPGNSVINGIMELEFFENKVMQFIEEIVSHITSSAEAFADGKRDPIKNHKAFQSKSGKDFLERFEKLLVESGYKTQ